MKYIKGFLMAWGGFCSIPCPYHGWDESSRKAMLIMLPLVGYLLAAVTSIVWFVLSRFNIPAMLIGVLIMAAYFLGTGFIHLDGFMDCSDALMSRRPSLAERQRILKAPDVGAFAVISVILMFMIWAACAISVAAYGFSIRNCLTLIGIFAASRLMSAHAVLTKPKMSVSQYSNIDKDANLKVGVLGLTIMIVLILLPTCINLAINSIDITEIVLVLLPTVGALVFASLMRNRAIKQLGGMNGDISGYMITMSETFAIVCMTVELYVV